MCQRRTDQQLHYTLGEIRFETECLSLLARTFQHLALALIIARRDGVADLVGADFGDNALSIGDERDELAISLRQTIA
jgi:hypothetical protein